jgi:Tol biopolymer transport system component
MSQGVAGFTLGWVERQPPGANVEGMKRRPVLVALLAPSALLALILIVALAAITPTEQARGAFPGRNGLIAVVRSGCNMCSGEEIWVMLADGSHKRRLAAYGSPSARAEEPAFSPSGKRIAFVRVHPGYVIHVMHADGTHKHALRHGRLRARSPAFSRSGKQIVFDGWRGVHHKIFAMRRDGSHLHALTRASDCAAAYEPAFSPTRSKIAFVCLSGPTLDIYSIYVMRADGTHLRQLISVGPGSYISGPNWSPNGRKIAFWSFCDNCDNRFLTHVIRADGTRVRQLSSGVEPVFSPSGRRIAFTGDRGGIYVMRADGTHEHRLTRAGAGSPDWGVRSR